MDLYWSVIIRVSKWTIHILSELWRYFKLNVFKTTVLEHRRSWSGWDGTVAMTWGLNLVS